MSMVLSIYSQKGFREVTLPGRGQEELEILLKKELFVLDQDVRLNMERSEDGWTTYVEGAVIVSGTEGFSKAVKIEDGSQFEAKTPQGGSITVICFEQTDPFAVYRKYALPKQGQIKVGRNEEDDICYKNTFVSYTHCTIIVQDGQAILRDSSKNGTYVNFKRVYGDTILKYGDSIRVMRLNIIYLGNMIAIDDCDNLVISMKPLEEEELNRYASDATGAGERTQFRRSPRHLKQLYTEPFEIEAPPNPPENQEAPLAMVIGPSLTMAIPMLLGTLLTAWGSNTGSSGAYMYMGIITALASAVIGAMWAVLNVWQARKTRRQQENRRFESYSQYLIHTRDQIAKIYNENSAVLRERYMSVTDCCTLDETSPLLWNRNATHEDFLAVRLGMGEVPFQSTITIPKEKFTLVNDTLADKPKIIRENFSILKDVPVTVDLLEHRLVGITGGANREAAISIAKVMIAQIAASNCYTDVKVALVYDGRSDIDREAWDFTMWLPHVWSGDKKIRYVASNKSEMDDVFHSLTQTLRIRSEQRDKNNILHRPHFILFVTDPALLDSQPILRYIFNTKDNLGFTTLLLAPKTEELPNECEHIIECTGGYQGIYVTRNGRDSGAHIQFDCISDEQLWKFAKTLGRIEVSESEDDGEIPNTLTFFDMFGIQRPDQLEAEKRWRKSNSISSMKAVVGFKNGNTPCYLDIHERYHGPHGLVAGTTGSGKSETLQTYILSLAVNFSPEDIGFFIIDYKGGGMANLFDGLPHMIGSISNLSGNQVKRAMVSIQSENRRRQRVFTEYGVNNINGYTSLYKSGDAIEPIPHLFIIIDEFAELKREEPEFMKELISVAQVGRSLGVHLILSTQRPSGTVDENIWANSKFRLCLRVQDRQDSMDMLHRAEAAYLTQAGRCYLQVGNDEIFELFQSGWSGASYDEELGGSSLLIAQMLSATGKVELAGNHAKIKRKEELTRRWVKQLIHILQDTEEETGIHTGTLGFRFDDSSEFQECFYQKIHQIHPDFEENRFNSARIEDFCSIYHDLADQEDEDQLANQLIRTALREGKRLPELKTRTQLEVTADYLRGVAEKLGMTKLRKLWLPVLPSFLYLDEMDVFTRIAFDGEKWQDNPRRFSLNAIIGMADDPANQAQFPASIDFVTGGHHMVVGTVSTGKSTLMQTIIYSLAACYTPELLNIYCLDFSAKMLSVFSELKHVGGYMDEADLDTDRLGKFFTMIDRMMDERKEQFTGTSFEDYVNHHGWNIPAILIVIDNFGSFHEKTGDTYEMIISRIAKEGIGCGIFLLVSAGGIGMQELPNRLAENFRTGICLEMPDAFAYADVLRVVRPPVLPETKVKGRGLLYYGERILEFQAALAAHNEDGPERTEILKKSVAAMNAGYTGAVAKMIPTIPEHPTQADFAALSQYSQLLDNPEYMPIGYDFEYADIYSLNLVQNYIFLLTGTRKSGKSNLMENLMFTSMNRGDDVAVLEIGDNRFAGFAEKYNLRRCTNGEELFEFLSYIYDEMIKRSETKKVCMDEKWTEQEMFSAALQSQRIDIFMGNMMGLIGELHNAESPAYNALELFEALCERGKGYNIFLYSEIADKDEADLMGYNCFENMVENAAGIRFGGRFSDQHLFQFENIGYQDQERSMKCGVGVIPSESREERLIRVVIPLS